MKTILYAVFPLWLLPCSVFAGAEREAPRTVEHAMHAPLIEDRATPQAKSVESKLVIENNANALEQTSITHPSQVKAKVKDHSKPLKKTWARSGTIILIASGAMFFLGLIFLLIGAVSFYGYGLILLGGIFMILSSIGLTVGLIVGAVG